VENSQSLNSVSPSAKKMFLILVILGFCLRVGYGAVRYHSQLTHLSGNAFISFWEHDARYHVLISKAILSGQGYTVYEIPGAKPVQYGGEPALFKAPLYQYFLAGTFAISGFSFLLFLPLQSLMGGLIAGLTSLIALRVFRSLPTAWIAGLAAASHPILVNAASQPYNENLFFFLFIAAVWLFLIWLESPRPSIELLAGITVGLCMLTRESASLLLMALGAVLLMQRARFRLWRGFALIIAMTLAVVLPWTAKNWIRFHAFVPVASITGADFADGNNECLAGESLFTPYWAEGSCPQMNHELSALLASRQFDPRIPDPVRRDQTCKQMARNFVLSHPFDYVKLSVRRFWTTLLPFDPRGSQHRSERLMLAVYWLLIYPAGIIGVIRALKVFSGPDTKLLVWLIVLNLAAISAVLYWSDLRFRIGIDLLLACFAAWLYAQFLASRSEQKRGASERATAAA
jgi:4-amino-4-deoxy-L-arabinose transferase-like glycosyltransferase